MIGWISEWATTNLGSRGLTPEMAGVTVGALVGIVGFVVVLVFVGRSRPRPLAVVAHAGHTFVPSTELSARAFARMHDAFDDGSWITSHELPKVAQGFVGESFAPVAPSAVTVAPVPAMTFAPVPAVTVTPVVMVSGPAPGASIADLDLDDGATQISETVFDELPPPRRRGEPPRIRPIAASPARMRELQPAPAPRHALPRVTPPARRAPAAAEIDAARRRGP